MNLEWIDKQMLDSTKKVNKSFANKLLIQMTV